MANRSIRRRQGKTGRGGVTGRPLVERKATRGKMGTRHEGKTRLVAVLAGSAGEKGGGGDRKKKVDLGNLYIARTRGGV